MADEFRKIIEKEDAVCFIKYAGDKPVAFAQCQLRHDYVEGTESSPVGYLEGIFVALWLPCFDDVDKEYERLAKYDVNFPCGAPITFDFGIRNFYVADPEGNLLEIGSMNVSK